MSSGPTCQKRILTLFAEGVVVSCESEPYIEKPLDGIHVFMKASADINKSGRY